MLNKIRLLIYVLTITMLSVCNVYAWETIKYDTIFGTTDKPVKTAWNHINSNQYHIEARFIVAASNSAEVTYNIYDGDSTEPTYTTTLDQTDIKHNNKWVLLGWYHPAFTGTIRVEIANTEGNLCIDAVRLSTHHCEETIIISNERDDNSTYTGTWETVPTGGYDDSYVVSTGAATHTWTFNNLTVSNDKLSFDYYFHHVENEVNTPTKNTSEYNIEEMLPKSGHYIFYSRTRTAFNTGTLDNYSRDLLISKNVSCRCEVNITEEMTIEEIRNLMYESGQHSLWVNTSMEETTLHKDCTSKAYWVYGYIAPPGPIVLE